jgi:hypothetical protein
MMCHLAKETIQNAFYLECVPYKLMHTLAG